MRISDINFSSLVHLSNRYLYRTHQSRYFVFAVFYAALKHRLSVKRNCNETVDPATEIVVGTLEQKMLELLGHHNQEAQALLDEWKANDTRSTSLVIESEPKDQERIQCLLEKDSGEDWDLDEQSVAHSMFFLYHLVRSALEIADRNDRDEIIRSIQRVLSDCCREPNFALGTATIIRSFLPITPCVIEEYGDCLSALCTVVHVDDIWKNHLKLDRQQTIVLYSVQQIFCPNLLTEGEDLTSVCRIFEVREEKSLQKIVAGIDTQLDTCTNMIIDTGTDCWNDIWFRRPKLRQLLIGGRILKKVWSDWHHIIMLLNKQDSDSLQITYKLGVKDQIYNISYESIHIDDETCDYLDSLLPPLPHKEGYETVRLMELLNVCENKEMTDRIITDIKNGMRWCPVGLDEIEVRSYMDIEEYQQQDSNHLNDSLVFEITSPTALWCYNRAKPVIRLYLSKKSASYMGWMATTIKENRVYPYYLALQLSQDYVAKQWESIDVDPFLRVSRINYTFRKLGAISVYVPSGEDSIAKQRKIIDDLSSGMLPNDFKVKKFTIVRSLGHGSYGNTYLAEYRTVENGEPVTKQVAMKEFYMRNYCIRDQNFMIIHGFDHLGEVKKAERQFMAEAERMADLANLSDGTIARVDKWFIFEGTNTAYYTMKYYPKGSLQQELNALFKQNQTLTEADAIRRIIRPIGKALSVIHENNLIHLDVKPDNIMIDEHGNGVLIDFGIARFCEPEGHTTRTSSLAGTPTYMPPEIYDRGITTYKRISPRSDIFSLGVVLYYILTQGDTPPYICGRSKEREVALALQGVSEQTVNAIITALAMEPEDRPQSVQEFLNMLPK